MMCKLFIIFGLSLTSIFVKGQALLDSSSLEFWEGEWNLTWKNPDGTISKGRNLIEKTLDGKVFQEHFIDERGFKGTSISVYNSKNKSWHQAWADNQGGYFNFIGKKEEENFVFETLPLEKDGKVFIQKMVFKDVKPEGYIWDWMASQDGGKTWKINWRINYTKVK